MGRDASNHTVGILIARSTLKQALCGRRSARKAVLDPAIRSVLPRQEHQRPSGIDGRPAMHDAVRPATLWPLLARLWGFPRTLVEGR